MFKSILFASAALLAATACLAAPAAELTAQEIRWLQAAAPVLAWAQQGQLPIDIVVQPQAGPDDVPMAMGFDGRRCKLVLSMRGRSDDADAIFAGVVLEQRSWMIEAMAAHEVGHCWRYVQGVWHALPAAFAQRAAARPPAGEDAAAVLADAAPMAAVRREIMLMRREEAFSDLLALAWTARRQSARYPAVLAWLRSVRGQPPLASGGHDTVAWLDLAADPASLTAVASPFEAVALLWRAGPLTGE
ncbi:hypothetical protein [Massilia sp. PWRC2]|uniref:hypothetical protein n=1 Tax=Massilia sp. PWRC2 TaxID=2804626 RepID=UPI003CEEBEF5